MALTQINPALFAGATNTTAVIQSNGTTAITVDSSQNVGIGTGTPGVKLDLNGGDFRIQQSAATARQRFIAGSNQWNVETSNSTNQYAIYDAVAGLARMIINSSGYVTTPYNPAFVARKDSVTNTSYSEVTGYDSTDYNIGSCFSTSTGRFTAPIAGLYFFYVDLGYSSNSYSCDICKNGSRYMRLESNGAAAYWMCTSVAISLAANDVVSLYKSGSGNNNMGGGNQGGFGGFLIG